MNVNYKNMKKDINIRKTMKALQPGEHFDFELAKYDYVMSCRSRLQADGRVLTSGKRTDDKTVRITRTS